MGRYAQNQRRGGGRLPPPPISLISLTVLGGTNLLASFTGPVTVVTGHSGSELNIAGNDTDARDNATSALIVIVSESAATPGDAWDLIGQPDWCLTPLRFPATGICF